MITAMYNKFLNEGVTEDYVGLLHSILKTSLNTAVKWEYVHSNILTKVTKPRKQKKEMQTWSFEEARKFLDYMKKDKQYYYILYMLAIYTGMRRGEILGLRWGDINFETEKINIKRTLYYTPNEGIYVQSTKNEQSSRAISISNFVIEELKKYRISQKESGLQLGIIFSDDSYVVTKETGQPLNPNGIYIHFTRAIEKVGLKKIRFHDLRHTHATLMLHLGEHPKIVSERLGHSSIEMTMNTYSHVTLDMQKESSDRFEKAFRKTN
ncbi:site-specific integrase [Bacillus rhizoplanae]|uniref:site-specific integrase n=1 Tax=Bacillus rhizoplanae TaxID=2880966 RepID=UPI003D262C3A